MVRVHGSDEGAVGWLHTEVMLQHLLVEKTAHGWRLSGIFDFEPSWVGPRDYELAAVGVFVAQGNGDLLKEVMRAAGMVCSPERIFAMACLHRYANLGWYQRLLGGPVTVMDTPQMWFG